jgi:Uma2 family endonuclease
MNFPGIYRKIHKLEAFWLYEMVSFLNGININERGMMISIEAPTILVQWYMRRHQMVVTIKIMPGKMDVQPDSGKLDFRYSDIQSMPEFPDGPLIEIIAGDLFMVPSPTVQHQEIVMAIAFKIREYILQSKRGKVLVAPVDVILSEKDVVVPDILYISNENENIIKIANIQGTPDLIVEVLSTNTKRDTEIKKKLYQAHLVKEYWIVNPEARSIVIYTLGKSGKFDKGKTVTGGTPLESRIFLDLHCTIDALLSV